MSGSQFEIEATVPALRLSRGVAVGLALWVLSAFVVTPALADCSPAAPGLVSWWPGDGAANDIAFTNNGTLQGGATASAVGLVGQAFSFNGTNGYVQVANSLSLRPTNLTVECWVRFSSLDSAGSGVPAGVQYIVFKQNTRSSTFEGFDLGKTRVAGNDIFRFTVSSAAGQSVSIQSSTLVSTGAWYHVAGVRGSNFVQLYVNGTLERQTNVTFAQDYGNFPLYFGTSGQPTFDRKLKGNLDEVSLYNRALSSNEIAAVFAAGAAGKCKAPNITLQPLSQAVLIGSNATFSVAAMGLGTLSYQWRSNNVAIVGATNTSLTLSNAQPVAAADYSVIVANSFGSTASVVATLTVLFPPTVTSSPASLKVLEGGVATFAVAATGTEPLLYRWQKDGIDLTDDSRLSGTTNSTLNITPLQFGDAGGYRAVVSNPYGMATSAVATLTVATNLPPLSGSIGAWGDLDRDGLLDVLLAGTIQGVPGIPDGRFTRLYHNTGGGFFDPINVSLPQLDNASAAWGDFDNDGNLDLLISGLADGTNGPVSITEIYRNVGNNQFTNLNAGLEALAQGSVAWVDFDNDGLSDVFVNGLPTASTNWVSRLYRNNGNGSFSLAITNLITPQNSRSYWADYDNDGYVDLLQGGSDATYLLKNLGDTTFSDINLYVPSPHRVISPWGDSDGDGDLDFVTSSSALPMIWNPDYYPNVERNDGNGVFVNAREYSIDMWLFSASWGDIDNSGRACVIVSGWVPLFPGGGVWGSVTKVYINLGANWQEVFTLGGWDNRSETWVDYDGDGDLDIFTTGAGLTTFWNNNVAFHRDFPQPPLNPTNTFTALDAVTLSWQSPADTPATGRGLTYNVRVGHTPGGVDVVSPLADVATGMRLVQTLGNAGSAHVFKLSNVPPGNYYWSVQSIGQSYTGSPFTAEGMFTVTSSPPVVVTQPTNQTILASSNAVLAVTVDGTKPLSYQWRKGGGALTNDSIFIGVTSPVLTIPNAQPYLGGDYDVVITNIYGAITSSVAMLNIQGEPWIVVQPVDRYSLLTRDVSFTVAAAGAVPLGYQWLFNGVPLSDDGRLSGATMPTLTIQNVQSNDFGGYSVIVSNAWGSITSSVAALNLAFTRYVNVNNPSPAAPYLTWATAATVIQDAINAAGIGDLILVTNGVYQSGSVSVPQQYYAGHRVALDKPMTVMSVNGPDVTTIVGGGASSGRRCAYLTNGAMLAGFTLTGGRTDFGDTSSLNQRGAGVLCQSVNCIVSNCIISGNIAGRSGGGAYSGTLINCTIVGNSSRDIQGARTGDGGGTYSSNLRNCVVANNSARYGGGGVMFGSLTNCLLRGNSAVWGGGAYIGTLVNCTVAGNSSIDDGGLGGAGGGGVASGAAINSIIIQNTGSYGTPNFWGGGFSYCCTSPQAGGEGNINVDPLFVDFAGGNYRLASNSPCLNAGTSGAIVTATDLNGAPRIVDGIVDLGAYEFQHQLFIVTPPVSQSVILTSNVLFTVFALGDEPLSYQWQKDGVNLANDARVSGAATASLAISNLLIPDAGGYRVVVTNASGSVTSVVATLTLLGLPTISVQPVSRTVPAATNVTFSVTASGLAAISYQWRFNQSELTGKTNSSLSLTNVQSANAGDYDVVITNIYGAITSSIATLTVLPTAPIITTQAVSRVASVGQTVSFIVAAKGTEPMTCQWQFNGADLPGANAFTLNLTNVNSSFAGTYRAAVSNAVGFAFSTNVTLVVSPVIIWGLTNNGQLLANAAIPATVTNVIAIAAAGSTDTGLPCLALRADGTIVPWGYSSRDPAPPTNAVNVVGISISSSGGSANNLVLLADGSVVNWTSSTKPPALPVLTNQSIVAIAAGGLHQLALRHDGTVIAWGSNTSGQTNVPPSATNIIAIAAGTSHSLALRSDGTVVGWGLNTSGQASALSNAVNVIAIAAGGNQSMALLADGTVVGRVVTNTPGVAVSYGPPVGNTTNKIGIAAGSTHSLALGADRTINGWGATNFGQINIPGIATNALAIAAGGNDSLALVPDPFAPPIPPRIGRPPLSRALKTGDNVVLNALAVGGLPLRYQWLRDGTPLAGKTNQWLALTSAHPSEAGDYQLVAMNDFGSATSVVAAVTVSIPQPMLLSPGTVTNGFHFSFTSIAGVIYVVEFKDILGAGAWTELERRFGVGGLEIVTDTSVGGGMRFYRVRALYAPSPKMGAATWSGGAVNFNFATVAGAQYVVEYTDQLSPPQWNELQTISGTGSSVGVADPAPTGPQRFYRLRVR